MMRSLYSAVSGIDVNQKSMDVIGNNIANVNTIGFKTGRAVFQDMLSQTLTTGKAPSDSRGGINPRQVGTGAYLVAVDNIFTQGTIKTTGRPQDLAIEGDGFFIVRGGSGNNQFYTRAGDFNFDRDGYLTTPSGYRVQGWMTNPDTGRLESTSVPSDIVLTPAHKIMQPKATTKIEYAGVLDTRAKESQVKFAKFMTQATGRQSIFGVYPYSGGKNTMDLQDNDAVRISAHATGMTTADQLYDKNGQSLNLTSGSSSISFKLNGVLKKLTYSVVPGADEFNSLGSLATKLQDMITAGIAGASASVTVSEGRLVVKNTGAAGAPNIEIKEITSTAPLLTPILKDLEATISPDATYKSREFFFQNEIRAGADFNNLDELSTKIQNAINGNVVPADFTARYLENNFGLSNGDKVKFGFTTDGGALTPFELVYSSDPNASTNGVTTFNTIQQYVDALTNQLNTAIPDPAYKPTIVAKGGTLYLAFNDLTAGKTIKMNSFSTETSAGAAHASQYLESIFNPMLTHTFDSGAGKNYKLDEIAGKGRIIYGNGSATGITGFNIIKGSSGDVFDKNVLIRPGGSGGVDISSNGSAMSQQFLAIATEDTNILDLFNPSGKSFEFNEGSSINFAGKIGGEPLTNANNFAVTVSSTVKDLMDSLEKFLGLDRNSTENVKIKDGEIWVYGEPGAGNNINTLQMQAEPASDYAIFNGAGIGQIVRSAEGGRMVTNMIVYDQQGNEHVIQFDFAAFDKEQNEWTVKIKTDEKDAKVRFNGATTNELVIRFNADGTPSYIYDRFADPIRIISNPTIDFDPGNGTNTISNIAFNTGTAGKTDGLTISAATTDLTKGSQDGYALGALEETQFNPSGEIMGVYTNGRVVVVGQVGLATFANNQGLAKIGDTMFIETANSGEATIGVPMAGSRGQIASNSLEQSNVDLSHEFVNMIVTERGFQANSRVVTTSDEMIQELLNLKR